MSGESDVITQHDQLQAEIFALKMDHFEDLFDWLSLADLLKLGQTCKRMRQIVDYYIRMNYSELCLEVNANGLFLFRDRRHIPFNLNGLSLFLKKIKLTKDISADERMVKILKSHAFESLTEIRFFSIRFTDEGLLLIRKFLGQLETLKLFDVEFLGENKDIYEHILKYCNNLKKLYVDGRSGTTIIGVNNSWLLQKYPKLEVIEIMIDVIDAVSVYEISQLQTFFQLNPQIKSFMTNLNVINANRNAFDNTELKLDSIFIYESTPEEKTSDTLNSCRDHLNGLRERGVFREFHAFFYDTFVEEEEVSAMEELKCVTKLYVDEAQETDLSSLVTLTHLVVESGSCIDENTANVLINLEFIRFGYAYIRDVLPFIRYSPKLQTIVVHSMDEEEDDDDDEENGIPKIKKLNEERSQLANAKKITIYVDEGMYLWLKWTEATLNWDLIEIKRGTVCDELRHYDNHDFQLSF